MMNLIENLPGKKISIISVNYNQPAVTGQLLDSIFTTNTYPSIEIIIVDNGSSENFIPIWQDRYPQVKFIHSEVNLGFAGGNNLGIGAADGDYLFLVNNDTEFTAGLLETLVGTFQDFPDTGIVCPKIRYFEHPGKIQYVGFTELTSITARNQCVGQFEDDKGQYDQRVFITAFAHGAAMMVSREACQRAGLMAENFFLYYEEMDWSLNIRKAGFKIRVNTSALIYHKESVSVGADSPLKIYYMNRNRILLVRKHFVFYKQVLFCIYFGLIVFPRNFLRFLIRGKFKHIAAICRAVYWNLSNSTNSFQ
ncbi:glycosyltransferase family 2 protein [Pedobacter sp. P26]|uniref:glycosyltransferase family 2 protein n=1 Tax=Pedobacter sp. P26 TaxID=3423956 RepID=UPI003D664255